SNMGNALRPLRSHKTESEYNEVEKCIMLPDDIMLRIIRMLGLIDSANLAATCSRFYCLETRAGASNIREEWETIEVDIYSGIVLSKDVKLSSTRKRIIMHSNSLGTLRALRRIFQTTAIKNVNIKVNLCETAQRSVIDLIPNIGAAETKITHKIKEFSTDNTVPLIGGFKRVGYSNLGLVSGEMERLYDISKSPSISNSFFLPLTDAVCFAQIVMGINHCHFYRIMAHTMTTSRERGKVYYTGGTLCALVLVDGDHETIVYRSTPKMAKIITYNLRRNSAFVRKGLTRIPYVAPRHQRI
ncbi:hypothetical protein PMAYCL1PPCAC_22600, partial [Pristionchus mayeri]